MYGLDLFSGIGGLTKALEGYSTPVAYCENDRHATAVLLSRMSSGELPIAPVWDDIRTFDSRSIFPVDIVYGGFPCQDISVAGRGEGLDGKRSGLFSEVARLVGEIRPAFVFLENVPAITSRGGLRVTAELTALGYDARWCFVSAADVGANHRRERWWLLAHTNGGRGRQPTVDIAPQRKSLDPTQREKSAVLSGSGSADVADANSRSLPQPWRRSKKRNGIGPHGENMAHADSARRPRAGQPHIGFKPCSKTVADTDRSNVAPRHESSEQANKRIGRFRIGDEKGNWWSAEPNVGRVADGVPLRVDRLRGLGNAVVPAQARRAYEILSGRVKNATMPKA